MIAASSVLLLLAPLALAPAPVTHSKADLEALLRVAEAEAVPFYGHCGSEGGTEPKTLMPTIDRDAEAGFARAAEIRNLLVRTYPYAKLGRDADKYHNDDVSVAVQQYELAYACNPGWDQRRYLDAALEMVLARRAQVKEGGGMEPPELLTAESRLRDKLAGITPPKCPKERPCIPLGPVPPPLVTRRGRYMARAMEILSLRLEFGVGFLARWHDSGIRNDQPPFITSVAPGVRFLAGKQRRHVFGLGFRYNLLDYVGASGGAAHQLTARFEYGIRAHPKWFSIHAGFEPGIQSHPHEPNFGHSQVGGFGSLCTWNEALCLRLGGSAAVVPYDAARSLDLAYATFGVDVFRVIENRLTGPGRTP